MVYKIVLTGGPCGGKTTVLKSIEKEYGDRILIQPEAASMLFNNGYPRAGRDLKFTDIWGDGAQEAIITVQKNMENAYVQWAQERNLDFVILDRGILDCAAFMRDGLPQLETVAGLTYKELLGRYDAIIHLESVAVKNPDLYEKLKKTNPARTETSHEASKIDDILYKLASKHMNNYKITSEGGLSKLISEVLNFLSSLIDVEHERKFLLPKEFPSEKDIAYLLRSIYKTDYIKQGYLLTDSGEIRLRSITNSNGDRNAFITIKGDGSLSRREWERQLPLDLFDQLWEKTNGKQIYKDRNYIKYNGFILEFDQYKEKLSGLLTLEIETKDKTKLNEFVLPDLFKDAIEITNDQRYKNKNLACYPEKIKI